MAILNEIKGRKKSAQRIGRGGKRGTTSGRGTKGQKSRAGRRIRPAERDLVIRIPKRRGFRNKPTTEAALAVNLSDIKGRLKVMLGESKNILTRNVLRSSKMIGSKFNGRIKLLGQGEIDFPITVRGIDVSKSAREKIEKAGGSIDGPVLAPEKTEVKAEPKSSEPKSEDKVKAKPEKAEKKAKSQAKAKSSKKPKSKA